MSLCVRSACVWRSEENCLELVSPSCGFWIKLRSSGKCLYVMSHLYASLPKFFFFFGRRVLPCKCGRNDRIIIDMLLEALGEMMDLGDGHPWIQPEFHSETDEDCGVEAVTKGTSWSLWTFRCTVRWKEEQEEEVERTRKRNRERKGKDSMLEFNQTSKANFYF